MSVSSDINFLINEHFLTNEHQYQLIMMHSYFDFDSAINIYLILNTYHQYSISYCISAAEQPLINCHPQDLTFMTELKTKRRAVMSTKLLEQDEQITSLITGLE